MRIRQAVSAQVDEQGRVIIPAELAAQFGVQPGANLNIHIEKNKLAVFRPVSHLAKVYIEPTSRCNLTCRTCIRNIWNEATGLMSEATFSRTLEGLRQVDPLPTVFFGGFGEPLSHPRILSMIAQVKGL
jgi:antitoxin component of MazEF toxin-antitoxin module